MSYARIGVYSDVYVFHSAGGWLECCGCSLTEPEGDAIFGFARIDTPRRMLRHLDEHVSHGHLVPDFAYDRIREEYEDLDAPVEVFTQTPEQNARMNAKLEKLLRGIREAGDR